MRDDYKVVRDPIHGSIRFEGLFLDLLESPELQRLHSIKQLGFAYMVFPGANHTRLEHSMGAYHMAKRAGDALSLKEDDRIYLECSALLHDIGHGPFSHTLESLLRERFGIDHVDLTERILKGEESILSDEERDMIDSRTVVEILEEGGIDRDVLIRIIRGRCDEKRYMCQLLNSPIDVDQLDYLLRDGYYTGVAYGTIDVDRFFDILTIDKDELAVKRKGVSVVENILISRELMYSSVYFHKTVRIAELMLSRAIEHVEDRFRFYKLNDWEMMSKLREMGGLQREMVTRLKYRRLFKQIYQVHATDREKIERMRYLEDPRERRKKEEELEVELGIPEGHIIIDVPGRELFLSEPRIDKVEIPVICGDGIRNLDELTPIARAIKEKVIPDWYLMVISEERYRREGEKIERILLSG
ncbi:MAG: hypothetical protein DRN13_03185 [Thermoplasmata archaeon]|nr:MAG: hypothetical protein DRN13_03185 [Thermoplasmata archaeon]